jgi:hypothetical protein
MPGVREQRLPFELGDDPGRADMLKRWRKAALARALAEVERRDWARFVVVTDSEAGLTAVQVAGAVP